MALGFEHYMSTTKAVIVLWTASASLACAASYGIAYHRSAEALIGIEQLDLGGGQSFAMAFPSIFAFAISIACAFIAIGALLYSCRISKNPLLCAQHLIALIFLAPLGVVVLAGLGI